MISHSGMSLRDFVAFNCSTSDYDKHRGWKNMHADYKPSKLFVFFGPEIFIPPSYYPTKSIEEARYAYADSFLSVSKTQASDEVV